MLSLMYSQKFSHSPLFYCLCGWHRTMSDLGAIRWPVADPGCGSRTRRRPTSLKRPRLGFRRSATTLYPSLTAPSSPDLNPLDYFVWSYVENITNINSYNTKASLNTAIRRVCAEYALSSRWCLCKRHAPSSGSVSRR